MTTRVLLSDGMPRILRDLVVRWVREVEELEVDDCAHSTEQLAEVTHAPGAQTIVFSQSSPRLPGWVFELLERNPRLRFLRLDDDGRSAALFQLRLEQTRFDELSPETLVAVLHEPARGFDQWIGP